MPEDIVSVAREIRNNDRFRKEGVNVNFVKLSDDNKIQIRTYERGVEDETLACGTGSVAAGIVSSKFRDYNIFSVDTQGGTLGVSFNTSFKNVVLSGPAVRVYTGLYCM